MIQKVLNIDVLVIVILAAFLFSSCSRLSYKSVEGNKSEKNYNAKKVTNTKPAINTEINPEKVGKTSEKPKSDPILEAETNTSDAGKAVLEVGRIMVFEEKAIIKGACWDYINEVFKRAGYGTDKKVVFKSVKAGPYADISKIQPGDWLYYINYSYGGIEHSGIFVYWADYDKKIGVTLSYGGEKRNEPGRYLEYDLKSVYYITRPGTK